VNQHVTFGRELRYMAGGMIAVAAVWPFLPLHPPGVCPLRTTTGIPCPFCGMTRAVVAAVHGNFADSLRFNPLGIAILLAAIAVLVRPQLLRIRIPVWPLVIGGALLWGYNVAFNPTFT